MRRVIDCFTLFDELDLLEFRLKLLNPVVDLFVIAESDHTHAGSPKPFHFENSRERFKRWADKIHYIPLRQSTEGLKFEKNLAAYDAESGAWKLENGQRNALSAAASFAKDEDIVMVSDLDEIPDPQLVKNLQTPDTPRTLVMLFHYYFMNSQNTGKERWWNGTVISSGKDFRNTTPQSLRTGKDEMPRISQAGWHFSYLGGLEKIKNKIQSFAHTEYNKEEFISDKNILTAMRKGKDIFKRGGFHYKIVSLYYYPPYLQKAMMEYPQFLQLKGKMTAFQKFIYSFKNRKGYEQE